VSSPAAVLALVLLTTAVGSAAFLWLSPSYGKIRAGYDVLTGVTIALIAWGAAASLSAPIATLTTDLGTKARTLTLAFALLTAVASLLRTVRIPAIIARVIGVSGLAVGVWAFYPLAVIRADRGGAGGVVQGVTELALGSVLMGAIWVGMILGHWYLVERRLTNLHMVLIAWLNVVAVAAGAGSVLLSWRNPAPCAGLVDGPEFQQCAMTFAPILRIGSMTIVLGLGVLALIALISGFNVKLAREGGRSIQASTGMFYLAVILAPAVEFAAKVRYF